MTDCNMNKQLLWKVSESIYLVLLLYTYYNRKSHEDVVSGDSQLDQQSCECQCIGFFEMRIVCDIYT